MPKFSALPVIIKIFKYKKCYSGDIAVSTICGGCVSDDLRRLRCWPNDTLNPRNIIRNSRVNTGCVRFAAKFSERRDANLAVHALEFGMNDQQRTTGIALHSTHYININLYRLFVLYEFLVNKTCINNIK